MVREAGIDLSNHIHHEQSQDAKVNKNSVIHRKQLGNHPLQ